MALSLPPPNINGFRMEPRRTPRAQLFMTMVCSPSVMKALATESRRHRGKSFFLFSVSLCLRGNFLSRQRRAFLFLRALGVLRGSRLLCFFLTDSKTEICREKSILIIAGRTARRENSNFSKWLLPLLVPLVFSELWGFSVLLVVSVPFAFCERAAGSALATDSQFFHALV